MFKFLRERRQRAVLTLCEAELARTQKAYAVYATPHDLATQAALLDRATAADLADHLTIKRLAFLHRLLTGLAGTIEDSAIPAFIDEARALGLSETDGIRLLLEQQCQQAVAAHGPAVIERTGTGHNRRPARLVGTHPRAVETSPRLLKCPFCAEDIQSAAIVCKHCGRSLIFSVPPAPFWTAEVPRHQIAPILIVMVGMFAMLAGFSAPGGSGILLLIGWLVAWGGMAYLLRESSVTVCLGGSFLFSMVLLIVTASCHG